MKFVLFFALATVAFAAKLKNHDDHDHDRSTHHHHDDFLRSEHHDDFLRSEHHDIQVLSEVNEPPVDGVYRFNYELENGVNVQETSSVDVDGHSVVEGSYTFITPEGQTITVNYRADGPGGFQAQSDAIPQPPPMPAHALELIEIGERLNAEGVQFDQQGFRI